MIRYCLDRWKDHHSSGSGRFPRRVHCASSTGGAPASPSTIGELLSREERLISAAYPKWAQSKGVREDAGENVMPMLQAVLGRLNRRFSGQELLETRSRREMWAPGKSLGQIARESRTAPPELLNGWATFLDTMPVAIQETIRAVAYAALSADPPVEVTFAWAPGYDFEVNVWQSPDTKSTRGGITLLLRSRYPDDRHPVQ